MLDAMCRHFRNVEFKTINFTSIVPQGSHILMKAQNEGLHTDRWVLRN